MFTALLAGLAFAIGAFLDKIIFAVMVLMMARVASRIWSRIKRRLAVYTAPLATRATAFWTAFRYRVRFMFGPTVVVAA